MFGKGKIMGGGAARGGGGILKTVSRAASRAATVTNPTNLQEPYSSSSSSRHTHKPNSSNPHNLSISAHGSPFSSHNLPISANSGIPGWGAFGSDSVVCDDFEWVSVDGTEDEVVLGPVPSLDEVQHAVSAIKQVFDVELVRDKFAYYSDTDVSDRTLSPASGVNQVSPVASELDWMEPSPFDSRMMQAYGYGRVYDAFNLLRTEPTVQKMVVSLSSDKAVWDAVLNNEAVRELRESYQSESSVEISEDSNSGTNFLKWIFESTKAKFMEVIEKLTQSFDGLFKSDKDDEKSAAATSNPFEDKLRTSFLLSIMVLLVVVVTRATRA